MIVQNAGGCTQLYLEDGTWLHRGAGSAVPSMKP